MARKLKALTERGAQQAQDVIERFNTFEERDAYARYLEQYTQKLSVRGEMSLDVYTRDEFELELEALKEDTRMNIADLKKAYNKGEIDEQTYIEKMYEYQLTKKNWTRAIVDEQTYGMSKLQSRAAIEAAKVLHPELTEELDTSDYKERRALARKIRRGEVLTDEDWKQIGDKLYAARDEYGNWDDAFAYIGKEYFGS